MVFRFSVPAEAASAPYINNGASGGVGGWDDYLEKARRKEKEEKEKKEKEKEAEEKEKEAKEKEETEEKEK